VIAASKSRHRIGEAEPMVPTDGEVLDTTHQKRGRRSRRLQRRSVVAIVAVLAFAGGIVTILTRHENRPKRTTASPLRHATSPDPSPAAPHHHTTRPPVGAAGFPISVYPAPVKGKRAVPSCPKPTHLQLPGSTARHQAIAIAEHFQSTAYHRALHMADRAIWSQVYTPAQQRKYQVHFDRQPVLSAGPLYGRYTGGGAPNPAGWISHDCPPVVGQDSYEVAIGPRDGPALDGVFVFVQRAGRLLLYFAY
jgi:hypothetical protein